MKILCQAFLLFLICSVTIICSGSITAEDAYNKGKEYVKENNKKGAYKYFKIAAEKDNDNPKYHWAAASVAENDNQAFVHTKAAWENGYKNFIILQRMTQLSFHNTISQKLNYALSLFEDLPDTGRTEKLRGVLYYQFKEYDSSIAIWGRLFDKNPTYELANEIALAHSKKGDKETACTFLSDCKKKKLLDSKGYSMLVNCYALDYDYEGIGDLVEDAKKLGMYDITMQLEQAGFLILLGKYTEAERLIKDLRDIDENIKNRSSIIKARIMLSYIYFKTNSKEKLNSLNTIVKNNASPDSVEHKYLEALYTVLLKAEGAKFKFIEIRKKLKSPFIELIYAYICVQKHDFDEAVEVYKNLPRAFLISPGVIVDFSRILAQSGKYDEALAAISVMHKANHYTKNSLEIFRDLTLKKQLIDKSFAAQEILESTYKDDAGVQYGRAILAMKTGNADTALQILTVLTEKYPKEARFELAKISIYLLQEKYSQVVEECNNSKINPNLYAGMLAAAYIKLDKQAQAEKVYLNAIDEKKSFSLMMEFAQLLVNSGKHQDAVKVYNTIKESFKEKLDDNREMNALLLNNFAWSLLQDTDPQKKAALKAAKSAYDLLPDNVNILDTYASALIQNNKFKQCINVLANNTQIQKEPQLLYHLAKAYEKTKDFNNAVRNYRLIVNSNTTDNKIKLVVSKIKLKEHIDKLTQE